MTLREILEQALLAELGLVISTDQPELLAKQLAHFKLKSSGRYTSLFIRSFSGAPELGLAGTVYIIRKLSDVGANQSHHPNSAGG